MGGGGEFAKSVCRRDLIHVLLQPFSSLLSH